MELLEKTKILYNLQNDNPERLKFYQKISDDQKAEFINGKVVLHSPAARRHTAVGRRLITLLQNHNSQSKLGEIGYEKMMIHLTQNSYEPDVCFFLKKTADLFFDELCLFPAPDFVVEILSKRTKKNDRGIKYQDYAAHGIPEYWIIDPVKKVVEQYFLKDREYQLLRSYTEGEIQSFVIKNFIVPIECLFDERLFDILNTSDKRQIRTLINEVAEKEILLSEKEKTLSAKESVISEQQELISEKENVISEQAKLLSEKDEYIQQLLEKLKNQK